MSLITDIAEQLSDVADAIRAKTEGTEGILLADMPGEIAKIEAGDWLSIADRSYTGSLSSETLQAVPAYFFNQCKGLTAVDFPAVTSIGASSFSSCVGLATAELSATTSIGSYGFYGCTALTELDFSALATIGTAAFAECNKLASITIRTDSVCTLSGTSAFAFTPIDDSDTYGDGYIYVPSDLVDEYKEATNWATFADKIVAIEE